MFQDQFDELEPPFVHGCNIAGWSWHWLGAQFLMGVLPENVALPARDQCRAFESAHGLGLAQGLHRGTETQKRHSRATVMVWRQINPPRPLLATTQVRLCPCAPPTAHSPRRFYAFANCGSPTEARGWL